MASPLTRTFTSGDQITGSDPGTITWVAPEQLAAGVDGMPATAVCTAVTKTRVIYANTGATNDQIPVGSTIDGIQCKGRFQKASAPAVSFNWAGLFDVGAGAQYADNAAAGTLTTSFVDYLFGDATNKLGVMDDAEFISKWNNDEIGPSFQFNSTGVNTVSGSQCYVKVWYTAPASGGKGGTAGSVANQVLLYDGDDGA